MLSEKTVTSALIRRGLTAARRNGVDLHEFKRLTAITDSEIFGPASRVSSTKYIAMLRLIERLPAPQNLLYVDTDEESFEPFHTTMCIVSNSPDLHTAFRSCIEYRALVGQVDGMAMKREGTSTSLNSSSTAKTGPRSQRSPA
ncbi:hypothetical protein [Niveibacterium sp. SC-1]|uniref:hypothetical protein n=1 Tax=Niveibacterium sp. SC-1 TaxID=3135646 RepID=UPI00311F546C